MYISFIARFFNRFYIVIRVYKLRFIVVAHFRFLHTFVFVVFVCVFVWYESVKACLDKTN